MVETDKSAKKEFLEAYQKLSEKEFELSQVVKKDGFRKFWALKLEVEALELEYNKALKKMADSFNTSLQDRPK